MDENSINAIDMSSKTLHAEESKAKKLKLSEDRSNKDKSEPSVVLKSFEDFSVKRILSEDISSKTIFIEGTFNFVEGSAVLILEKLPFGQETVKKILTEETHLINKFTNNIYSSYNGFPKAEFNSIKTTVIHPATEKHIEKYLFQPVFVVRETPKIYRDVVLPHINSQQFSLQWVYNILEHKSEQERIVFEDDNPETGFVLLPDLKWNESETNDLYLIAICHCRGIRSVRDLTSSHLPLLQNIFTKGSEAIMRKYNIPKCKLRAYLHYHPSYYHLHVHFSNINYSPPGIQPERARILDHVISNLELMPDYYENATLTYSVKESNPLYAVLKAASAFD